MVESLHWGVSLNLTYELLENDLYRESHITHVV